MPDITKQSEDIHIYMEDNIFTRNESYKSQHEIFAQIIKKDISTYSVRKAIRDAIRNASTTDPHEIKLDFRVSRHTCEEWHTCFESYYITFPRDKINCGECIYAKSELKHHRDYQCDNLTNPYRQPTGPADCINTLQQVISKCIKTGNFSLLAKICLNKQLTNLIIGMFKICDIK